MKPKKRPASRGYGEAGKNKMQPDIQQDNNMLEFSSKLNFLLPHDLDAEAGVLNAAFCLGGMEKVIPIVTADDFYSETAKLIFSRLEKYHGSGRGFTLSSIDQSFLEHPQYVDIRRALDGVRAFTAEAGPYHAGIVKELADRRRAIKAYYEAFENLFNTSNPIDQVKEFLRVGFPGMSKEVSE